MNSRTEAQRRPRKRKGYTKSSNEARRRDEEEDPFPSALRPGPLLENEDPPILRWHQPFSFVTKDDEEALLPLLLRYGERERGMFYRQPTNRLAKLRAVCKEKKVPLLTALSLRRLMIKHLNPYRNHEVLGLGTVDKIREAAALFESAIEGALKRKQVPFWNEQQILQHAKNNKPEDEPFPPTPDFVFQKPVCLQLFTERNGQGTMEERRISWIEVKMFYGAASIPEDQGRHKTAVGNILNACRKYNRCYGEGAMVFLYGCSQELANMMKQLGTTALDCSGDNGIDLHRLRAQQQSWCADINGQILP